MKKMLIICAMVLMLTACSKSENTIETEIENVTYSEQGAGTLASMETEPETTKRAMESSKATVAQSTTREVTTSAQETVYCNLSKNDEYYKYEYAYRTGKTDKLNDKEMAFYQNLKVCLDEAQKHASVVDKEKAIHDAIIVNCRYDYENFQKGVSYIPQSSYTPEGVFYNGVAVCDGYSKAFKLCMDILGIENVRITGKADNGTGTISHAWNIVKLDDGQWYHVDLTWDDPTPDEAGKISYDYFNLSDKQMKKDHTFTSSVSCTADKYYYWNYYYDGMVVGSVDEFYEKISSYTSRGIASVELAIDYSLGTDVTKFYNMDRMYLATGKYIISTIEFYSTEGYVDMTGSYLKAKLSLTYDVTVVSSEEQFVEYIKQRKAAGESKIQAYIESEIFDTEKYLSALSKERNSIGFSGLSYYDPVEYGKGYLFTCRLE